MILRYQGTRFYLLDDRIFTYMSKMRKYQKSLDIVLKTSSKIYKFYKICGLFSFSTFLVFFVVFLLLTRDYNKDVENERHHRKEDNNMKTQEMLNSLLNLCNYELNNNHKSEDKAIESAKKRMQNEINMWFRVGIGTTKQLITLRNLFNDIIKCFDKVGE